MCRRRLLLLSVVLALLVLWGWLVLRPKPRPSEAGFDRIEEGMTREEVEAILGPPDVYSERKDSSCQEWMEDKSIITIEYSNSDRPRVLSKHCDVLVQPTESFRDRLRRWCERAFGSS